jgi:hypothetical protein
MGLSMVDQPPRPQIKIKSTYPEAHREEPVQEYVYHWDRIFVALAALLLLLGALGYGIFAWLKPSNRPAETEVHERHLPDEMVVGGPPPREEAANAAASLSSERLPGMVQAGRSEETGPLDITDVPVRKTPDAMRSPREPPSGLHTEHFTIAPRQITPPPPAKIPDSAGGGVEGEASKMSPFPEVAPKTTTPPTARQGAAPAVTARMSASQLSGAEPHRPEEEPPSEAVPKSSAAEAFAMPPDVASEPDSGDVVADSRASSQRSNQGLFRSTNTSIASPAVKRFLLAKDVVSNEPQGDIGDTALNDAGYVAVSSFSEVTGQQGETLQYRWLHNGKEVLRIRVPVGSNRWRSHSTKRIYAGMKGSWRAELRNSAGELLASIDFTF